MKFLKQIELKIKKILNYFVISERKTQKCNEVKNIFIANKEINLHNIKILILRQDRIGDLIVSTPFIRILREHFPTANIDILLSKYNFCAKNCIKNYINKYWCYNKNIFNSIRLLNNLKKEKYDLVIDAFETVSTTSSFIIKYINPKLALGIDKSNYMIYDYIVPMLDRFNTNIVERTATLLYPFGINPQNEDLYIEYNNDKINKNINNKSIDNKKDIFKFCINLSGSSPNRFWGVENNIKLIKFIKEKYTNIEIRIFSTSEYKEVTNNLKQKFNDIIIVQCSTFDDFAFEVSKCNFIISPDTSIVHLASAYKIPIVVLYIKQANTQHQPWYPYKVNFIPIETIENSIRNIKTTQVFDAIQKLYNIEYTK